jgi:hypothetical protein
VLITALIAHIYLALITRGPIKNDMRTLLVAGSRTTVALPRMPGVVMLARELKTLGFRVLRLAKRAKPTAK